MTKNRRNIDKITSRITKGNAAIRQLNGILYKHKH